MKKKFQPISSRILARDVRRGEVEQVSPRFGADALNEHLLTSTMRTGEQHGFDQRSLFMYSRRPCSPQQGILDEIGYYHFGNHIYGTLPYLLN